MGILKMNSYDCTIFIPLYNEEDIVRNNVEKLLLFMKEKEINCEIILGSNGSIDSTKDIILELAKEKQNIKSFHLAEKGPGGAFIRGVHIASSEYIIAQDIDVSVELEFIPLALKFLESCDMVIGSKRMRFQKRSFIRKLGSNFFIFMAATLLGIAFADFSIGAKGYRRSFVLKHQQDLDPGTCYVLELVCFAANNGQRIVELAVDCKDNRPSHFNLLSEAYYKFYHLFRFAMINKY
jgi:glycosyltransferase involved in cell wall biosynthesis